MVIVDNMYLAHRDFLDETDLKLVQLTSQVDTFFAEKIHNDYIASNKNKVVQRLMYSIYKDKLNKKQLGTLGEKNFFEILSPKGQVLITSRHAPVLPTYLLEQEGLRTMKINGRAWRINVSQKTQQSFYVIVGQQAGFFSFLQDKQTRDIIAIILSTYLLLGLLVWLTINRSFSVIKSVTKALMNRDQHFLEPIEIHQVPIELRPFTQEINRLLACLHDELEREKRFAADASHELRTSLSTFYTQAEVALQTKTLKEKDEFLRKILVGIKRSVHLIQQLLSLSRTLPEATIYTTFVKTDVIKHTETVVKKILPRAQEKHIRLTFYHPEHPVFLTCNPTAMEILLRNLLDNAIGYTPNNGSVSVHISKRPKHVVFSVIDSGPGIPKHLRTRVFDRFFRVVGGKSTGSGLGLSIIKQIVHLHRATISLSSTDSQKGLHVKIVFPSDLTFKL
jgi:two-component system sensor histidine kinase QseC